MARYLLKIDGSRHAPGRIVHPRNDAAWDGGEVILTNPTPRRLTLAEKLVKVGDIEPGDELLIWTNEGRADPLNVYEPRPS